MADARSLCADAPPLPGPTLARPHPCPAPTLAQHPQPHPCPAPSASPLPGTLSPTLARHPQPHPCPALSAPPLPGTLSLTLHSHTRFCDRDGMGMKSVGRSIRKGGQNVHDLQRQTGSVIRLPRQDYTTSEDTTVHIVGPFFSVQSAQRRIRAIIQMSAPSSSGGGSTGRPSRGPLMPRMHQ
ncbi:Insulin-like growth factor 2 mRNA-binding protein 2 [Chionoecetes opilio]|uniref:Insulin-like growth factor 2 mRNA-binding protein 2 n=1 Tax=Chionoecetes opilio TaxID=41210 RepID=A0A8J4Y404_CHIOP|nr:Insulin-like growth factor 2 mRNA-binding protein 2 [Chionoecetes opilio]